MVFLGGEPLGQGCFIDQSLAGTPVRCVKNILLNKARNRQNHALNLTSTIKYGSCFACSAHFFIYIYLLCLPSPPPKKKNNIPPPKSTFLKRTNKNPQRQRLGRDVEFLKPWLGAKNGRLDEGLAVEVVSGKPETRFPKQIYCLGIAPSH